VFSKILGAASVRRSVPCSPEPGNQIKAAELPNTILPVCTIIADFGVDFRIRQLVLDGPPVGAIGTALGVCGLAHLDLGHSC